MRLVRRHRLDDPRITDEARAVLIEAAMERRMKVWPARHRSMGTPHGMEVSELDRLASRFQVWARVRLPLSRKNVQDLVPGLSTV
jgi:hypothetical protein